MSVRSLLHKRIKLRINAPVGKIFIDDALAVVISLRCR